MKTSLQSSELLDSLDHLKRDESQLDEAVKYYEHAVQLSPPNYGGTCGQGGCALLSYNLCKAIDYFQKAVTVDPKSSAAQLALGDALQRDNKTDATIHGLKAAVKMQPDMPQSHLVPARAYAKLGQSRLVQETFKKDQELAETLAEKLTRTLDTQEGRILVAPELGEEPPRNQQPENHP